MAVKGQQAKETLTQELLSYFGERAFKYDKEIRVECIENGERVQIKVALTAAKVAVEKDGDVAIPGAAATAGLSVNEATPVEGATQSAGAPIQPTAEEKKNISELLAKLGL